MFSNGLKNLASLRLLICYLILIVQCVQTRDWKEEKHLEIIDTYSNKDFKQKGANEITLEDIVENRRIKKIYNIASIAHIVSNVFLDFCWLPK